MSQGNIFSPGLAPAPARPKGLRPEVAQLGPLVELGAGQRWLYTCAACEIPERFVGYPREFARTLVTPKHRACLADLGLDPEAPGAWQEVGTPAVVATATTPASAPAEAPSEPHEAPAAATATTPATTAPVPTLGAPQGSTMGLFADERVWSAYQEAIFADAAHGTGNTTVLARAGTGKCLGLGTMVMRFDGTLVRVEDVQEGDLLMGPDSQPRRVLSTTRGYGPLFRIVPVKGEPWVCNDVHVLTLAGTNRNAGKVIDVALDDHLAACAARGERPDRNWKLFRVGVDFPAQPVEVEPYLLGLWLGDGTSAEAHITNSDEEIVSYCRVAAPRHGVQAKVQPEPRNNTNRIEFCVGRRGEVGRHTPNPLRRFFASCLIDGEKRIPAVYLHNNQTTRLDLLAGLLDTDGYLTSGSYEIVFKSKALAEQVAYLARSLDLAAYLHEKTGTCPTSSGTFTGTYYRLSISGDLDRIPCKVARRKAAPRRQIKRVLVTGFTADPIGDGFFAGFELDGDGRFLLGDFTVTHNTTTLTEAVRRMPQGLRVLVLAFNASIKTEIERRMPQGVEVRTLHSLGALALRRAFPSSKMVAGKVRSILEREEFFGPSLDHAERRTATAKLVGFARATLLDPLTEAGQLCRRAGVDPMAFHDQGDLADASADALTHALRRAGRLVARVLEVCRAEAASHHDFDDMLWLPAVLGLSLGTWDRVVVDEAQDLSAVQIALLPRTVAQGGRVLVVGDDRQAIYAFRGANAQAFAQLTRELNAKVLPLTITYRCPQKVVALARQDVPDFEAGPGAPEGIVRESKGLEVADLRPGDFVLSRSNAPLVSLFFRLIGASIPAVVQGREGFLTDLIDLVRDAGRPGDAPDEVRDRLLARLDRTIEARARRGDDLGDLPDQRDCLRALFDKAGTPAAVVDQLRRLSKTDEGKALKAVCLSSVHRSKGLERERVFVLVDTFQRGRSQDEDNLWYVAITRTKRELVLVSGEAG